MNKQRKVLTTITYNEMGIIIDTKVEEVAQPNLQLATETISRQGAIDALEDAEDAFGYLTKDWREVLEQLPPAEPQIIRCKECKHWIPYDWMFSEVWQSRNIADYPEDEIGCACSDMAMKANDFCSRGERRTE